MLQADDVGKDIEVLLWCREENAVLLSSALKIKHFWVR